VSGIDIGLVREVLRDLQRDHREEPFFAELFATRATGFIAATGAARAETLSAVSVEQMTYSWEGLCALLEVPVDVDASDLEDLLDRSPTYEP
jgi:hypothetical protein